MDQVAGLVLLLRIKEAAVTRLGGAFARIVTQLEAAMEMHDQIFLAGAERLLARLDRTA